MARESGRCRIRLRTGWKLPVESRVGSAPQLDLDPVATGPCIPSFMWSTALEMTPAVPLRAIGYIRVSTDEQADSGLGLEASEPLSRARMSRPSREVGAHSATPTIKFPPLIDYRPVEVPAIGDALELVLPAVLEHKTAASR